MLYVIRITTFIASQDFGNEILFKIYISFHRVRDFDSIYNVAIIIIEIIRVKYLVICRSCLIMFSILSNITKKI